MSIPTEPIGSIPRPKALIDGMGAAGAGTLSPAALDALYDEAVVDTLRRFAAIGSTVVTDGEQRKPSFATYPVAGLTTIRAASPSRSRTATRASSRCSRPARSPTRRTRGPTSTARGGTPRPSSSRP
jgi:methionine synthase II (cobalamin-independent)